MPRYKLTIEYDGTPFHGWQMQAQAAGPTVQGVLAEAVERFCGEPAVAHGAGRTDAGVHALAQVAHLDLSRNWPADRVREALNHHLKPHPVAVLECRQVTPDFDARFSAVRRHYLYRIANRRAPLTLFRDRMWRVARPLDAPAMHDAAQLLVGRHDFTTFRASQCQAKSPVKTLQAITVTRRGAEIEIAVSARSFLHHQVRSITGALKWVGEGKWQARDLRAALQAADRRACAPVAPAAGLYLVGIDYPPSALVSPGEG